MGISDRGFGSGLTLGACHPRMERVRTRSETRWSATRSSNVRMTWRAPEERRAHRGGSGGSGGRRRGGWPRELRGAPPPLLPHAVAASFTHPRARVCTRVRLCKSRPGGARPRCSHSRGPHRGGPGRGDGGDGRDLGVGEDEGPHGEYHAEGDAGLQGGAREGSGRARKQK